MDVSSNQPYFYFMPHRNASKEVAASETFSLGIRCKFGKEMEN